VEKPFGHDLALAVALNALLTAVLTKHRSTGSTITWARKPFRNKKVDVLKAIRPIPKEQVKE